LPVLRIEKEEPQILVIENPRLGCSVAAKIAIATGPDPVDATRSISVFKRLPAFDRYRVDLPFAETEFNFKCPEELTMLLRDFFKVVFR
jgi:hypothetical protein